MLVAGLQRTGGDGSAPLAWALATAGLGAAGAATRLLLNLGELDQLAETLRQARTDDLTGLANRRGLLGRIDAVLAQGEPFTVALVDLDRFKEVNDGLGHAAGDELLAAAAVRLRDAAGPGAEVGRLGGDEFALLLPGTGSPHPGEAGAASAAPWGAHLVRVLEAPYRVGPGSVHVGGSVGLVVHGGDPRPAPAGDDRLVALRSELLRRADAAMYAAKRSGGGWAVYDPDVHGDGEDALRTAEDLRRALVAGGAGAALPAAGAGVRRGAHRCGGPGALAAPRAGPPAAGAVPARGGGPRPHRPGHRRRARAGRGAGRRLAPAGPRPAGVGERLRHRPPRHRSGPRAGRPPAGPRGPRLAAGAGGHRDRAGARHRARLPGAGGARGPRRGHEHRRLRHRLVVPGPAAPDAVQRAQAGQVLHAAPPHRPPGGGDHREHGGPRPRPGAARGGRGRGGPAHPRAPGRPAVRRVAGLLARAPRCPRVRCSSGRPPPGRGHGPKAGSVFLAPSASSSIGRAADS
ncbi:MAG: GGDEF domain-containing protein [Quadrisphaera sp.]